MLFVQFWINSTGDVWKLCQTGLAWAARPILAKFSLVLLIPNCTHNRMIIYTTQICVFVPHVGVARDTTVHGIVMSNPLMLYRSFTLKTCNTFT